MKKLFWWLVSFIGVVALLLSVFHLRQVVGDGMAPTIPDGKTVVFSRVGLAGKLGRAVVVEYQRGASPSNVGRIIGLPTESVRIENGNVYIDDNVSKWRMEEEYLLADTYTTATDRGQWVKLDRFEYLVMQDSKRDSLTLSELVVPQHEIKAVLWGLY